MSFLLLYQLDLGSFLTPEFSHCSFPNAGSMSCNYLVLKVFQQSGNAQGPQWAYTCSYPLPHWSGHCSQVTSRLLLA